MDQLRATAPQINLSDSLKRDACSDGLRGRLPDADALRVGDALIGWEEAEARDACHKIRGDELVGLIDRFNSEWEAWRANRRR